MEHAQGPNYLNLYHCWSWTVTNLVWNQWRLFDSQCQAGLKLLNGLRDVGAFREAAPQQENEAIGRKATPEETDLVRSARERIKKGLAPPKEIYQIQNRERIDWSEFPEWAKPIDPEVFEGSGHEG